MKKINQVVLYNALSTVLINGISFFTAPIFSRLLGTENYGVVAVFAAWVSIAFPVFSLDAHAAISPAKIRLPEEEQSKYRSSTLFLALVSIAGFSLAVLAFLGPLSSLLRIQRMVIVFILAQTFGQTCVTMQNAIYSIDFQAKNNLLLALSISLGGTVVSLLLFRCFGAEENYYARILGFTVVYCLAAVLICIRSFSLGRTFYHRGYWRFCLAISLPYIFHSLAGVVLGQSDRLMIKWMIGDAAAGVYSLAFSFGSVMYIIWQSLNQSWVPFYYQYMKEGQLGAVREKAKNYIELFTVLTLGFVLLTPEVYYYFANADFFVGYRYIPLFALGFFFSLMYSFPANYEMYHGKSKIVAGATMSAAVFNVILNYFLIRQCGVLGAVIATVLAHLLVFVFHYICARRLAKGDFPFDMAFLGKPIAIAVLGCLSCYFVGSSFAVVRWALGALIGIYELRRLMKRKSIF